MAQITLPETIYVNNVPHRPGGWSRERHGYVAVKMYQNGVPVSEHLLPVDWLLLGCQQRVYTGGNWYSTKPGGDLTPPGEVPHVPR